MEYAPMLAIKLEFTYHILYCLKMRPDRNQGPQQFRMMNSNNLLSLFGQRPNYTLKRPYIYFKLLFSRSDFFSPWIRDSIIDTREIVNTLIL